MKSCAVVLIVLAAARPVPASAASCSVRPVALSSTGVRASIDVDWRALQQCTQAGEAFDSRLSGRVTEDTVVEVSSRHFNFVNYTIEYGVDESVVASYVTLEKLFAQLIGLTPFQPVRLKALAECTTFDGCLAFWAWRIERTDHDLADYTREFAGTIALSAAQESAIADRARAIALARGELTRALEKILADMLPETVSDVDAFARVRARHDALLTKLDAYTSAAALVAGGERHAVGRKKPGTIVTITLTPKNADRLAQPLTASAAYFVHSRIPLVFHAGYSYSGLRDVRFDRLRGLANTDLFSEVQSNAHTSALTAFLSLGRTWKSANLGAYGTIGTDFTKPGDRIYVGGSVQLFKRLFVSTGIVGGNVSTGADPIVEELGTAVNARELFGTIASTRQWKPFGAISFGVF